MPYYPIMIDVKGKPCVVIGGGQVALRKVEMLLECGALVRIVSPDLCPEIEELRDSGTVEAVKRRYERGDLADAVLVIAATAESDTNRGAMQEAAELGVLFSAVDAPDSSSFISPACLKRGDLTIAVSTNGKSPALARKIRTALENDFGEEYAMLVSLVNQVRVELADSGVNIPGEAWQQALDMDVLLGLLRTGRQSEARERLRNVLEGHGTMGQMASDPELAGPQLCMVGVNHDTSPLLVRERLSIPHDSMRLALDSLRGYIGKGVILATCNRTEIYALKDGQRSTEQSICRFFEHWSGMAQEELEPYLHNCWGHQAMRHLVETASGLNSMIVGEYEVLGQVRQALEDAEQAHMVDLPLRNLFQHAVRTGRKVREETSISKNALSVSSVAVDLATKVAGDIHNSQVLLIGAGEAGKLVAKTLSQMGVSDIRVTSRSLSSATELASVLGGTAVDIGRLRAEISASDIVVTCTGAPHYVVRRELIREVMRSRPTRPLVIIDIAVPRDVEADVRQFEGVSVYDIDDFMQVSKANRKAREREISRATKVIDGEMGRFVAEWQALEAKPTIGALMKMAEDIRQHQLRKTLKKLPPLSREQQENLESMTKTIVSRILHNPIRRLKSSAHRDDSYIQTVEELFDLNDRHSG